MSHDLFLYVTVSWYPQEGLGNLRRCPGCSGTGVLILGETRAGERFDTREGSGLAGNRGVDAPAQLVEGRTTDFPEIDGYRTIIAKVLTPPGVRPKCGETKPTLGPGHDDITCALRRAGILHRATGEQVYSGPRTGPAMSPTRPPCCWASPSWDPGLIGRSSKTPGNCPGTGPESRVDAPERCFLPEKVRRGVS